MNKVRLAVIGCGTISQLNVPGYLDHPQCDIVALYDPIIERAERRAFQWGITPRIHDSFENVLNDSAIDAVELLTPTHLHPEQIIASIDANKHISCQKPISGTVSATKAIERALGKSSKTFRITENFLYYPPIVKAKELIDSGAVGELSMIRIRTIRGRLSSDHPYEIAEGANEWRRDTKTNAGGLMYDDGWHKVATAIWWGGDVERVSSIISKTDDFITETPSAAIWKYANKNCLAVFEYASAPEMPLRTKYYPADEFMEIIGSEGVLWVTRCTGEMLDMPPVVLHRDGKTTTFQVPMDWIDSFKGAAADFIDSLISEKQPQMDIHFAKKTLQATLAFYESSETGLWIQPDTLT